jgi:hypothetical protein
MGTRDSSFPQEHQLGIVVGASLQLLEALWRREFGDTSLFHHNERAGREPATIAQRGQCFFGELHTIRRIEKHQRERLHRVCRAEIGGITTVHFGNATEPERLVIVALAGRRLCPVVNKQREGRAARVRLDP